jgi:hypothetical protein
VCTPLLGRLATTVGARLVPIAACLLGFDHYGAHGSDFGAGTTAWLAQAHPESVVGIHLVDLVATPPADGAEMTAEERAYLDASAAWSEEEGAFARQ